MATVKKPNQLLRYEREKRGLSQRKVAELLDTGEEIVSRWERGERKPSPFYQEKLCTLFDKDAVALGFLDPLPSSVPDKAPQAVKEMGVSEDVKDGGNVSGREGFFSTVWGQTHALDLLLTSSGTSSERQAGAWLILEASNFAQLFDEGWTLNTLMESLQVVMKGVQAMPRYSRRKLLQLGAAAVVSNIVVPESSHPSAEDRTQLCSALGESIGSGWHLFHTAGNAQVLAVSHAQLILVRQSHAMLPSRERSGFYSSVYNLMGKALHFQERYQEALEAHINAHVAAMGTGDALPVVQSLICQADSYQALSQNSNAIDSIEEALRLIGNPGNEMFYRAKAHLLACWAENALAIGEHATAREKLEASAAYLDQISPNEEFDRSHWLQIAGKHALATGNYTKAIEHYTQALNELAPNWVIHQAFILVPLMVAYACQRDREASIAMAEKAVIVVSTLNAPSVNKQFTMSVQQGLCGAFPHDEHVQRFMADLPRRLPALNAPAIGG